MLVTKENIHEYTIKYIEENNINIINFEESMIEVYLKMIEHGYYFTIDRELIRDIFIDIAYMKNPNDPLNKDLILMVLGSIDSDDENSDDENSNNGNN